MGLSGHRLVYQVSLDCNLPPVSSLDLGPLLGPCDWTSSMRWLAWTPMRQVLGTRDSVRRFAASFKNWTSSKFKKHVHSFYTVPPKVQIHVIVSGGLSVIEDKNWQSPSKRDTVRFFFSRLSKPPRLEVFQTKINCSTCLIPLARFRHWTKSSVPPIQLPQVMFPSAQPRCAV